METAVTSDADRGTVARHYNWIWYRILNQITDRSRVRNREESKDRMVLDGIAGPSGLRYSLPSEVRIGTAVPFETGTGTVIPSEAETGNGAPSEANIVTGSGKKLWNRIWT